jgi:hypothetical protein
MQQAQSLVFEYFFQIGAGLSAGIACVVIPARLVYLFIANKISARNARNGGID